MKQLVQITFIVLIVMLGLSAFYERGDFPKKPTMDRLTSFQGIIKKREVAVGKSYYELKLDKPLRRDMRVLRVGAFKKELCDLQETVWWYNQGVAEYNTDVTRFIKYTMRWCAGSQYAGVEKTFPAYAQKIDIGKIYSDIAASIGCSSLQKCLDI